MTRRPASKTYLRPGPRTTTMGLVSDGRHRRVSVAHSRVWETTTKGAAHNKMNHTPGKTFDPSARTRYHRITRTHNIIILKYLLACVPG